MGILIAQQLLHSRVCGNQESIIFYNGKRIWTIEFWTIQDFVNLNTMQTALTWITLVLIFTCISAEKKVLEVWGSGGIFGGLYMQTNKDYEFRKLGGPDKDGYHFFLFRKEETRFGAKWVIGDRKDDEEIIDIFYATGSNYRPPWDGWKNMEHESERFKVVMKSGALSLLKDTEASGGSATSDGGIICSEKSTKAWILIDRNDMRICNKNNDCENGLDEQRDGKDCQRDEQPDSATRVGPTVLIPITEKPKRTNENKDRAAADNSNDNKQEPNSHDSSGSISPKVATTIGFGGLLVGVFLAFGMVKVISKRSKKEDWDAVRAPKQDNNLYYGLYYRSDSTRIDESTVEFVDENTYYEASSSQ